MNQESPLTKYVLKRTLQHSLFGSVILAKTRETGEYVVVKLSSKERCEAGAKRRMLECPLHERAIYQRILRDRSGHPGRLNVVNALSFEEDELHEWLVLEHCEQGDLLDLCRDMEPKLVKNYFRQMLQGVAYLHHIGVAHRDLSPENIFITKDNICKIGDFGQAIQMDSHKLTERAGKLSYMCPEAIAGEPVDAVAGDVFTLGVCLFIMLTGSPPWQEASQSDVCFYHISHGKLAQIVRLWGFAPRVPPLAVHLLNGMFRPQAKRLSLQDVISHPFLAQECLTTACTSVLETVSIYAHAQPLSCR